MSDNEPRPALTVAQFMEQLRSADPEQQVWVTTDDHDGPSSNVHTVETDYDQEAILLVAARLREPVPPSDLRIGMPPAKLFKLAPNDKGEYDGTMIPVEGTLVGAEKVDRGAFTVGELIDFLGRFPRTMPTNSVIIRLVDPPDDDDGTHTIYFGTKPGADR